MLTTFSMLTVYPNCVTTRSFSSAPSLLSSQTKAKLKRIHQRVPAYPHNQAYWYKQSNFGLYGGAIIRFGNVVSSKNKIKNRRTWKPNIHWKRLWSESLSRFVRTRVHTRVLRTIDKVGGLDEYLLSDSPTRIKELGMEGWRLRWRVMRTDKIKERFRMERVALGLPEDGWKPELTGVSGETAREEDLMRQEEDIDRELDEDDRRATLEKAAVAQKPDSIGIGSTSMQQQDLQEQPRITT